MRFISKLALIISLIALLSSCITTKETNLLQNIPKGYPKVDITEYEVIPGDQLTIIIYSLDEDIQELFANYRAYFSWKNYRPWGTGFDVREMANLDRVGSVKPFTVYADGSINIPYLGKIYVAGFTIREIRKIVAEKLNEFAEGSSAEVTLFNKYFSVLGALGANRYDMTHDKISIYQALATSSSIQNTADISKVSIIRQTKDGAIIKTFDLRTKDIIDSDFYYIQANDVIYIPQSSRKFLGSATSFVGIFSLVTSIAGLIVFLVRIG